MRTPGLAPAFLFAEVVDGVVDLTDLNLTDSLLDDLLGSGGALDDLLGIL